MTIVLPWWLAALLAVWALVSAAEKVAYLLDWWGWRRDSRPGGDGEDQDWGQ